jgi:G3E family GTPase
MSVPETAESARVRADAADAWQMLAGFLQAARVVPEAQRAAPGSLPLTVISGFLGSGKTTLLNRLLSQPHGRRLAVLVNDFGRINIDAELVVDRTGDMVSLANGCACCSVAGDLAKTIVQLAQREEPPDAIVLEASGLADPRGIVQVALANPALRLDGIVTVVDAETVLAQAEDRDCARTLAAQLDAADVLVLNKQDLACAQRVDAARQWLAARAPGRLVIDAVHADVPVDVVLGIASENSFADAQWDGHASGFEAVSLAFDRPLERERVRHFLGELPEGVVRAKGVLWLADDASMRTAYQRVGTRAAFTRLDAWSEGPRLSRLVIIGRRGRLDRETLARRLEACSTH